IVEAANDMRSEGSEGVGAFGSPPLQIFLGSSLPVALAHVVAASDTEDRFTGVGGRDAARVFANDKHQLAFEMDVIRALRDYDFISGILKSGDRFVKHLGVAGRLAVAEMALVIQTHGEDFRRYAWV